MNARRSRMGPDDLRKHAIEDRTSAVERINWFKWPICVLLGHAYVEHSGRYLKECRRCGRLEPIRRSDE
jgi:hypothetical protein